MPTGAKEKILFLTMHTLTFGIIWPMALANIINSTGKTEENRSSNKANLIYGMIGSVISFSTIAIIKLN